MMDDGHTNDRARSQAAFRTDAASRCTPRCIGWHLSNLDVWESCQECNPGGRVKTHPEEDCPEEEAS